MLKLINKPLIEDWRDDNYKVLASNSNSYLNHALEEGLLKNQEIIKKGVIPDGNSSIVYYVETNENRYVVKFALSKGDLSSRKLFFDEWTKQGVKTPHIYTVRPADENIPYELASIEFINANTLSNTYSKKEVFEKGYYEILGSTLAKMHRAKGKGFRNLKDRNKLEAKFVTLKEEIDFDIKEKRLDSLVEEKIFDVDIYKKYEIARDILIEDLGNDDPSLCHNDFHPYNIMATEPITVFDPSCSISSPIKDLGGTLSKMLINKKEFTNKAIEQMILSYESIAGSVDMNAVNAAIFINHLRKVPRAIRENDRNRFNTLMELIEKPRLKS